MPSWWPFGRRRRKTKSEKPSENQPLDRAPLFDKEEKTAPSTPSRQRRAEFTSPPSRRALSERNPSQPQTANTSYFPTENPSLEEITALPTATKVTSTSRPQSPEAIAAPGTRRRKRPFRCSLLTLFLEPRSPNSLRSKRSAINEPQLLRRKSAKSRKDQSIRESQIKAMSSPIPIPRRHGADAKIRAALQEGSAVSLPRAASVRSSVTGMSDNQYEVGGMDFFSPRPTIRYSIYNSNINASGNVASRTVSTTDDRFERDISPRKIMKESKTIDDLADNYDAHTLRELMERDHRRKERRRKAQEERARKRLEKYAETGEPGPSNRARQDEERFRKATEEAHAFAVKETEDLSPRNPFTDATEAEAEADVPVEETAASPPQSPIRRDTSEAPSPATATSPRRTSDTSSRKGGPLSSLLRRSAVGKRSSVDTQTEASATATPIAPVQSSFSNTSRESMSRQLPPAHLRERPSVPRIRSGVPQRTMSKFREDLPELPAFLPEEGATQSPDSYAPTARQLEKMPESGAAAAAAAAEDTATESPSVALLSQSMASVDSEASWLSGRPPKRTSLQSTPLGGGDGRMSRGQGSKDNIEFGKSELERVEPGAGGITAGLTQSEEQTTAGLTPSEEQTKAGKTETSTGEAAVEEASEEGSGSSESPTKPAFKLAHTRSVSRGSAKLLDITRKGSVASRGADTPPPPATPKQQPEP